MGFKVIPGRVKETITSRTAYESVEEPRIQDECVTGEKTYSANTTQPEYVRVWGKGNLELRKGNELFGQLRLAIAVLLGKFKIYGGLPEEHVTEAKATVEEYKAVKAARIKVLGRDTTEVLSETVRKVTAEGLEAVVSEAE